MGSQEMPVDLPNPAEDILQGMPEPLHAFKAYDDSYNQTRHGPDDTDVSRLHTAALFVAVEEGDDQRVRELLVAGADVEVCLSSGSPLHVAVSKGHAAVLPLLITPSTLVAQNAEGFTPLQVAAVNHGVDAARALVSAGAPLGPGPGRDVASPFNLAVHTLHMGIGNAQVPLLLLSAMLADQGSPGLVEGALATIIWGRTPLHWVACASGCGELVENMVEAGADLDAVDYAGVTPLLCAVRVGRSELVPLLVSPVNVNKAADSGTPLHAAAADGSEQIARLLLAAGAEGDIKDREGQTALAVAGRGGYAGVARLLLEALAKQQQQQQQQGQGGISNHPLQQQNHHQQQQQQQLVGLVASALAPLVAMLGDTPRCAQLLEVVLDVLGPGVAGEVCAAVQQQLLEEWENAQPSDSGHTWSHHCFQHDRAATRQVSYLAEALLLGWVGAVERLHAARQPLVARLQRLVPGVVAAGQQQQEGAAQEEEEEEEQGWEGGWGAWPEQQQRGAAQPSSQPTSLVKQAELAAAGGQTQAAFDLLEQFAALHLQEVGSGCVGSKEKGHDGVSGCSVLRRVHQGLLEAAMERASLLEAAPQQQPLIGASCVSVQQSVDSASQQPVQPLLLPVPQQQDPPEEEQWAGDGQVGQGSGLMAKGGHMSTCQGHRIQGVSALGYSCDARRHARSFRPPGVYTTFLAAWMEARRQLQQLPQEVTATVLAAVKAAHQREQQQQQEEKKKAAAAVAMAAVFQK